MQGWGLAGAGATVIMGPRPMTASPPAVGRESRQPGRLNGVTAGQLINMVDLTSTRRFLMDTGSSYSILPHQSSLPAKGPKLFGPAGQIFRYWDAAYFTCLSRTRNSPGNFFWQMYGLAKGLRAATAGHPAKHTQTVHWKPTAWEKAMTTCELKARKI